MGAIVAGCFFASLLAHELSHAIVARREGITVEGITLWLLGGVAQLRGEARTPGAEARVAGVGPLVSLLLALGFGLVALGMQAAHLPPLVVTGAAWLGGTNLVLGLFNLLPGSPLDGGRLLRAVLWRWRGSPRQATAVATTVGRALGYGLMGFGLFELIGGRDTGGLWTVILGFFLVSAAGAESQGALVVDALRGMPVRAAMDGALLMVPGALRVDTFISHVALAGRASAWLVTGAGGAIVGVVRIEDVRRVPAGERRDRRLDEVATPLERVPSAGPDELIVAVLERQAADSGGVLVIEAGQPIGFLGPREIADAVERARLVDRRGGPDDGRPQEARRPS